MGRKPRPAKKPKLITWELFRQVRHGDIVVTGWDENRAGSYRLVLAGPADYVVERDLEIPTSKAYITVPIHNRSWTNRATTLMNFYDLTSGGYGPSYVIRPGRSSRWLCQIETDILRRSGFDVVREFAREIAEGERCERLGLEKYTADCKRWLIRFYERAKRKAQA